MKRAAGLLLLLYAIAASAIEARVDDVGGAPAFVVDGRPHPGVCYSSYDCSPDALARRARQFAGAGCDVFNFVVEVAGYGYSRPMWTGRDQWDFRDLDLRARTILAAAPDAKLIPRIYLDAPAWWVAENPGERMVLGNGATGFGEKLFALPRAADFASLASEKWRADMRHALVRVLDHIGQSDYGDRVIGYQLGGQKTEEWYHWSMNAPLLGDYSPHMEREFRRWLGDRYGTDERLRAAWRSSGASLDAATIPTEAERIGDRSKTFRNPEREQPVIDFQEFWSGIMADVIADFARTIKERTQRRKLVGAFYAYTFEFAELGEDAGHLALGRLLRSPDVDFVMAPSSYFDRHLPGTPYFRAPVASLNLHGKCFWNDFDQVSFKYYDKLKADPALKQWEYQMGPTRTPEEFVWMMRREVGLAIAQGAQLAHFDIHGGYYEDPAIMEGVRQLEQLRREALAMPGRDSAAEILVLVDEASEHCYTFRNAVLTPLLSGQVAQLGFVAPYDALLLSDLPRADTTRYKLVLVLNAVRLDDARRRCLREKVTGGGRTVVWFHAPGYFSERGRDPAGMGDITGINIVPDAAAARGSTARMSDGATAVPLLWGEQFRVDDPAAVPLAVRDDRKESVVLARKNLPACTSVYSAAAPLPAPVLRGLAAEAGVHLYTDAPDYLVFAGRNHLTVCAPKEGGACKVRLPGPRTVTDAADGAVVCRDATHFTATFRPKEVRIYRLDRMKQAERLP